MPIYLTLQLTGSAAHHVTTVPGELLPHLFTLTHTEMRAVVFCHLNPKVTPSFPLRSVMLYVARTFLSIFPAEARKHERQTTILFYRHKDNTFFPNHRPNRPTFQSKRPHPPREPSDKSNYVFRQSQTYPTTGI